MNALPGERRGPVWSPDGSRIAFVTRNDDTPDGSIWIADADGSNPRQLFDPAEACPWGAWWPAWSPDGQQLAIVCYPGLEGVSALAVVDVDSLTVTTVVSLKSPEALDTPATWSADGSTLAFGILHWDPTNTFLDGSLIATVPADGSSEPTRLGDFDSFEAAPDWHPTEDLIAFNTYELGNMHEVSQPSNVYTMRPDGTQRRQITTLSTDGTLRVAQARWTSDGNELVATLAHESPTGYVEVVLVNAATGAVTKPPQMVAGARQDVQPMYWEPPDRP
jgi:Tol biopolymer transport system component